MGGVAPAANGTNWSPTDRQLSDDEWIQLWLSRAGRIGCVRIVDVSHAGGPESPEAQYIEAESVRWFAGGSPEARVRLYGSLTSEVGEVAKWPQCREPRP